MSDAVLDLLAELRRVVAQAIASHPQGELFDGLTEMLDRDGHDRHVAGSSLPVVDEWLRPSINNAPPKWRALAELLGASTAELPWLVSYERLESTPELEAFRSFYSYQLFAGPHFRGHEPPLLMEELLVGFTLQAPNVFYPQHHHEPPEMYGVISGSLDWQVGDTWRQVGPGDVIVHRPSESHAMRTGDEPALTWVVWPSKPNVSVYMPSFDPPGESQEPTRYA